jgi:NhaP-type Na+/H+ or K+/H+ antiporter
MFGSIIGTGANGTSIYASARDAGNFAAGAVANDSYLPTSTLLNGFGAYNAAGNSGVMGAIAIFAGNIMGNYLDRSPTHGEDPLSYKAINSGVNNGINYFWNTMWNTKK